MSQIIGYMDTYCDSRVYIHTLQASHQSCWDKTNNEQEISENCLEEREHEVRLVFDRFLPGFDICALKDKFISSIKLHYITLITNVPSSHG